MTRPARLSWAVFGALALAVGARAQARLVASTPAETATVAPLARMELHFSEPVDVKSSSGALIETGMLMGGKFMSMPMNLGGLSAAADAGDPKTLVFTAKRTLSAGVYRLDWRVVTADGSPAQGAVNFTVK